MTTDKNLRRIRVPDTEDIARDASKSIIKSLANLREAVQAETQTMMFELFWKHAQQQMGAAPLIKGPVKTIFLRVMVELDGLENVDAHENLKELLPDW